MKQYDELARHLQTDDNEGHDILDQIGQEYDDLLAACKGWLKIFNPARRYGSEISDMADKTQSAISAGESGE